MNLDSKTALDRVARRRNDYTARALEAAARLFSSNGFADTSMAAVAAEADVSVGTLYNIFGSKDALYRELVNRTARLFHDRLLTATNAGATPLECIDRYLAELASVYREHAAMIRLYVSTTRESRLLLSATFPEETLALYEHGSQVLAKVIAEGIARGELCDVDPYRAAVALQALASESLLLFAEDPERHPVEAVLADVRRIFLAGVQRRAQEAPEVEP